MIKTTYSMWVKFRNCRRACEWRYIHELVPLEKEHALYFGTAIHELLEIWHGGDSGEYATATAVIDRINAMYPNWSSDEYQRADWHLATAMMRGYMARYPSEDFDIIELEKTFEGQIINPETGAASRSFYFAGKIDGLVLFVVDGKYFLIEHKTASAVDAGYIEKLWCDFQTQLYSWYIEQTMGIKIAGVIYNILCKAKIRQFKGETEAEYQTRYTELVEKSKSGKSSAKRKMPETDEDYQARLAEWYAKPDSFHREMIYFSRDQFEALRAELWELTQSYLGAKRRGIFYQNTSQCFVFNRPCAYFNLCRSCGSQNVIDNYYKHEPPHTELADKPYELKTKTNRRDHEPTNHENTAKEPAE